MDVMDFTPGMGPASCFLYVSCAVQLVEPGVRICLQHAAEVGKVSLWMETFSVGAVGEPDCRRQRRTRVAVIAHVGPQTSGFRLLIAGQQHRDRRIIGVKLTVGQNILLQGLFQR